MFDKVGQSVAAAQNRFDLWQQRVPVVAFPISVWLRYREDRCYEYAALLSYYGFFSIFPLLTVGVTIIGFLLNDNPTLRDELLDTVFAQIPVIGDALVREIGGLEGSGVVLLVAVGFTLWAGIGVVRVAQDVFNTMWSVSIMRWPSFFPKLLRALGALVIIGGAFLVATIVSAIATFALDLPGVERLAGVVDGGDRQLADAAARVQSAHRLRCRLAFADAGSTGRWHRDVGAPAPRWYLHQRRHPRGERGVRGVRDGPRVVGVAGVGGPHRAAGGGGQCRCAEASLAAQLRGQEPHGGRRAQLRGGPHPQHPEAAARRTRRRTG